MNFQFLRNLFNRSVNTESVMTVTPYGDKEWRNKNHELDREDGPARVTANGSKLWYRNGQLDRKDGPAVEGANGTKEWWRNGTLNRDDGPAVEYADGGKQWWRFGQQAANKEIAAIQERTAKGEPTVPAPPLQPKGPS